jgi:hypothetical protein
MLKLPRVKIGAGPGGAVYCCVPGGTGLGPGLGFGVEPGLGVK